MKNLIVRILRALWRWTAPFRRPFVVRLDRLLSASLSRVMAVHASPTSCDTPLQCAIPEEIELLLDGTVRELVRLQMQVEVLQRQFEEVIGTDLDRGHLAKTPSIAESEARFHH